MFTFAIIATLTATAMLIATAIAFHAEASGARRDRSLARLRANHVRRRGV